MKKTGNLICGYFAAQNVVAFMRHGQVRVSMNEDYLRRAYATRLLGHLREAYTSAPSAPSAVQVGQEFSSFDFYMDSLYGWFGAKTHDVQVRDDQQDSVSEHVHL